ncbi:MAG: cytidylate kinase-like family protein [Armatimonadetes bacterium]|nr:cytidylate kinase-like family protein [Armatimonadota bacterium]
MDVRPSLLDRAARRWEIDRKLERAMRRDEAERKIGPVITISRELGSGGASVGKMLANQLDLRYYDRELIEEIAERTGSDVEHIELQESTTRSGFGSMVLGFIDRRNVQDTVYLRSLIKTLRAIAQEGQAVIIGRGGSCVLPDALRIRCVAPFEVRVERMAKTRGLKPDEARQLVLETDHRQGRFLHDFFGCDPNRAELYDLIINTANLSLEHAAELVTMRLHQTWHDGEDKA